MGVLNYNKDTEGILTFMLAFRIDAVAPVELVWSTVWIDNYNEEGIGTTLLVEQDERDEKGIELHLKK